MSKYLVLLFLPLTLGCTTTQLDKIVFSANRSGNTDIYLMDGQGQNVVQLTNGPSEEWAPTWLNEKELTFLRQGSNGIERVKINLDTKQESVISHPSECLLDDKNVIYAPKSKKWLYQCNGNIFVAGPDGKEAINLTQKLAGKSFKPSWFPDEQRVCFTNDGAGDQEIYAVNLAGDNLQNLTMSPYNEEAGEISPNGKLLLFSSDRDGNQNRDLYLQDLQTGEVENITNTPKWELIGRWSKSGKAIYFGSNKEGNWEIYAYDLKTKSTARLTQNPGFDGDPRILR